MRPVKDRFRLHALDAITMIGLLVVVAWTPVYWAQGGDERRAVGGTAFEIPDIRYGDRIEYELVFQQRGAPTTTTGTVMVHTYRAPDPGEGPNGTVLVEERHIPARNIDLGPARYVGDERTEHRYYDAARAFLGVSYLRHAHNGEKEEAAIMVGDEADAVVQTGEAPWPRGFSGPGYTAQRSHDPVVYRPESTWDMIRDLVRSEDGGLDEETGEETPAMMSARMPTPEERVIAPFAARHHDRILYAKLPNEEWWGPANLTEPGGVWVRPGAEMTVGFRDFDLVVTWEEDLVVEGPFQRWSWWAKDVPLQAGEHHGFLDKEGDPTHTLDLVPRKVQRGDQPAPYEPPPPTGDGRNEPLPDDGTAEGSRHDDPFDDRTPIVRDVSLFDIAELLRGPAAPASLGSLMDRDPLFAGLIWHADEDVELVVAVANGGTLRVAHIKMGQETTIHDACDRPLPLAGRTLTARCEAQENPFERHVRGAPGLPPTEEVGALRTHLHEKTQSPGAPEVGEYRPLILRRLAPDEGHGFRPVRPYEGWFPTEGYSAGTFVGSYSPTYFAAVTRTGDQRISFQEHLVIEQAQGVGTAQPLLMASLADSPKIIRPLGPEPAYGGLALVILGLLIRLLAALKSGAHLPLFAALYAKISKDQALDHEHREAIHGLVAADPGVTIDAVAKATGLSRTAAFHHLQTLGRNELLTVTRIGRMRHFFPADQWDPKERLRIAVARHEDWDRVLTVVETHPGITLSDLVTELNRSKTSLSRIGTHLAQVGLVRKEKTGRAVRYHPGRIAPDDHSSDKSRTPSPQAG